MLHYVKQKGLKLFEDDILDFMSASFSSPAKTFRKRRSAMFFGGKFSLERVYCIMFDRTQIVIDTIGIQLYNKFKNTSRGGAVW